jgi:elongation factor Tu
MVVFINKCDVADPEMIELVEMEVGEMLTSQGFSEDTPFIRGSATEALAGKDIEPIKALVDAMDQHIPMPERDMDAPFLMPIEGVCTIPGRGTVVTGRVDRGTIKVGDTIEVIGRTDGKPTEAVVTGIQAFHKDIPSADAGLNVGLLLRGVERDGVVRGQVVIKPGSLKPHKTGKAEILTLSAKEGGRHTSFGTGYTPQFYFGATDVSATIDVGEIGALQPGERGEIAFSLNTPVACEKGMRFAIREGGKTVGAGFVTEVSN